MPKPILYWLNTKQKTTCERRRRAMAQQSEQDKVLGEWPEGTVRSTERTASLEGTDRKR